ncbi:hypothetical protein [Pontibacter beigongshangensis]|uniref:hypothetical protein n=1 Tax=Pontibacter beigongshangensis TaxID=2574733 RepID=UPI00164FCEC8|nr:hypothetical protein [Pontibacter beigongshangensis]
MFKQDNIRHYIIKALGVLIALLSSYYLFKSGYHVLFYKETGGKDVFVFHFTRSFTEVVIAFIFWIIILIGGLGIYTDRRNGLFLGLLATCVALIPSLAFVLIAAGKVRTYSRSILINNAEREMTNLEKWDYIYADFFFSICLTLLVVATIVIIVKRRKYLEATKQNTIPQQSL